MRSSRTHTSKAAHSVLRCPVGKELPEQVIIFAPYRGQVVITLSKRRNFLAWGLRRNRAVG